MFAGRYSPTQTEEGAKGENSPQHLTGYSKSDIEEFNNTRVYRRKNPAARAARTTVTPDLAAEAALLSERLEEELVLVVVGVGTTVLGVVELDGLAGLEPYP
jgi:hypothetical protein